MAQQKTGNARKKQTDNTPGPWTLWPETDPADRAIRFITTYCRPPKGYGYGQPMTLAPFQVEWIKEILAPGVTAAVMQLPRGQGKSTLLAALAVWATFDVSASGEPQVPIIATTVRQAERAVYNVAVKMVEAEPELETRSIRYSGIGSTRFEVSSTGGTCFPMANSTDGLQGLDPSFAVCDEIGFQPIESWNSLLLATSKRANAPVVGIGTPGLDRDNALWQLRSSVKAGAQLPGFVYREYSAPEGCDHTDPANWHLANPALAAGYQNIAALTTALGLTPEAHFRIFHLGQWVDGTDAWLGEDGRRVWDALTDPYELVPGAKTWIGLDVGLKQDSTALVIGQFRDDGRLHTECRIWMPGNGSVVDPADVTQAVRDLDRLYTLVEVAYDPRHFEMPALFLADEGIPMVEFPQSNERMSPAFAGLYEAVMNKRLSHNGDQAYTTQVLNGVQRFNERGWTLAKAKSRGKIDAAYALALCHARAVQPVKERAPLFVGWA